MVLQKPCAQLEVTILHLGDRGVQPLLLLFSHPRHGCCRLDTQVMSNSFATLWTVAHRICCPWDFPGQNIGVGCHFLLQGIFLTQGLNSRLLPASLALQADSLALSHQVSLSSCRRTQICVSEGHVHPLGRSWVSASYCTVCVQLCPAVL